ncbi:MAG: hypothetical protein JNL08_19035 [Planctomycetes bacterium]|nr:hypothetical protein [Planctomycetota bacterium]
MTASVPRSRVRRLALRVTVSVATAALLLVLLELAARALWTDQYDLPNGRTPVAVTARAQTTRMHPPGFRMTMRADGIYRDGGAVRFRTDARSAVLGHAPDAARELPPPWLALGGSTTECALVPEGRRWPDLLAGPTANFGVSGNTCGNSLANLVSLLPLAPQRVLLMHAYNDVLAFVRQGEALDLANHDGGPIDLYATERPRGWFAGSRLLRFVTHVRAEWSGRFYLAHYQRFVAQQATMPWLADESFELVAALLDKVLLPQRTAVLTEIARRCAEAGAELVLLTQPHSYAATGLAGPDLRTSLCWQGQKLRFAHCARLLDAVNDHTRTLGARLGVTVKDVAGAFDTRAAAALFYDQVHYTPEGCQVVADALR